LIEVVTQENNGWWLVKKNGVEGWAPASYIDPEPQKPKAVAAPPAAPALPPAKRAVPTPSTQRESSSNGTGSAIGAGGVGALANALKSTNLAANKPAFGSTPAASTKPAAAPTPGPRPSAVSADANAAPVAVMPGMGAPGGFAAILAKKKAEAAAAAAANGGGAAAPPPTTTTTNGSAPAAGGTRTAPPKPAGAKPKPLGGRVGAPAPPPRRA